MLNKINVESGSIFSNRALNYKTIFILILTLAFALRFFDLINAAVIEMDGIGYVAMGENFIKGEVLEALKDISHPLYPLFLGVFHLFISDPEFAGRIVSLVFGMFLIYVSFIFFKRFFGEKKALYAAFLMAIHPYLVRYSAQVLTESLAIFLFTASILFFYKGWVEKDIKNIGFSGFFLALTYLTKAEYIIYCLPFSILLLKEKRYFHVIILLLVLLIFSFPYIYYIKMETGVWTITKKVCLSENVSDIGTIEYTYALPFQSLFDLVKRAPFVAYNFFLAVVPLFFMLIVLGFKRMNNPYRTLSVMLVVLHLLARTVIHSHSTRRYSVEFVPFLLIFGVEGLYALKDLLGRYRNGKKLYLGALIILIISSVVQGITFLQKGRVIHKEAGISLSKFGAGNKIVEFLPVATYYAKGEWVNISIFHNDIKNCNIFIANMRQKGVNFFIFDYRMYSKYPSVESCLSKMTFVEELKEKDKFVKIYKLSD